MVLAVRSLRDADNTTKAPRLTALRQTECKLTDVCELKTECAEAYALFLEGLDAVRAVKKELEADAAAAESATRLLDQAEQKVKRGRDGATRCAELEGRISTKYKIP